MTKPNTSVTPTQTAEELGEGSVLTHRANVERATQSGQAALRLEMIETSDKSMPIVRSTESTSDWLRKMSVQIRRETAIDLVRIVNSHQELLSAAKEVVERIRLCHGADQSTNQYLTLAQSILKTAIAKALGLSPDKKDTNV